MNERTRKPFIFLFKKGLNDKAQLAGTAKITYEKDQAATDAIAKYNSKLESVCVRMSIIQLSCMFQKRVYQC